MIEQFRNYIGYGGLLCYKDRDQGDTCQLEGIYISLNIMADNKTDIITKKSIVDRYMMVINRLEVAPGVYRRCSNSDHWGSNPNNLSRDNRSMLEIAMAVIGDKSRLKTAALYILKRFGFHQNIKHGTDDPENKNKIPDFISPGELSTYIRGLNIKILKPLLYILDLGLLADLYFRKGHRYYDNMLANKMLFDNYMSPTFISKYALKKYLQTNYQEQINSYYSEDGDNNGLWPMAKLYKVTYEKFTKNNN